CTPTRRPSDLKSSRCAASAWWYMSKNELGFWRYVPRIKCSRQSYFVVRSGFAVSPARAHDLRGMFSFALIPVIPPIAGKTEGFKRLQFRSLVTLRYRSARGVPARWTHATALHV